MLLWLQRAWSSDLRTAVIRGVKNVDVYKTSARIVICASSETTDPDDAFTSLERRQNPIEQALFGENLWKSSNLFFLIFLAPGRRLLLTLGMGMGVGTIRDHSGTFKDNFKSILDSFVFLLKKKIPKYISKYVQYTENDTESYRSTQNINI